MRRRRPPLWVKHQAGMHWGDGSLFQGGDARLPLLFIASYQYAASSSGVAERVFPMPLLRSLCTLLQGSNPVYELPLI